MSALNGESGHSVNIKCGGSVRRRARTVLGVAGGSKGELDEELRIDWHTLEGTRLSWSVSPPNLGASYVAT